jgi:two-component system, NtrC family, response regulator HydG
MEAILTVANRRESRAARLPILIVDDEPDTCHLMVKFLSALGYQAEAAQDGHTALRLVDYYQYGLAIIDYEMPGMNGVDLYRRIRRARPELAAVFVTGHTTIDVVFPAIEAGVLRVFQKPVDFRELIPVLEENLAAGGSKSSD